MAVVDPLKFRNPCFSCDCPLCQEYPRAIAQRPGAAIVFRLPTLPANKKPIGIMTKEKTTVKKPILAPLALLMAFAAQFALAQGMGGMGMGG